MCIRTWTCIACDVRARACVHVCGPLTTGTAMGVSAHLFQCAPFSVQMSNSRQQGPTAASSALSSSWRLACCAAKLSARASTSLTSGAGAAHRGASKCTEGPSGAEAIISDAIDAAVLGRGTVDVEAPSSGAVAAAAGLRVLALVLDWLGSACVFMHV